MRSLPPPPQPIRALCYEPVTVMTWLQSWAETKRWHGAEEKCFYRKNTKFWRMIIVSCTHSVPVIIHYYVEWHWQYDSITIFSQLEQISIKKQQFMNYDLTIWHSLCNWIRNHLTPAAANITILFTVTGPYQVTACGLSFFRKQDALF